MVITIDGIAASGKSTIGESLARRLNIPFLDTGAIYRVITVAFVESYKIKDQNKVRELFDDDKFIEKFISTNLRDLNFEVIFNSDSNMIYAFGIDQTKKLHHNDISKLTPITASPKKIREFARSIQYKIADKGDIVMAGRDIGTIVFPKEKNKFFITIDPFVRAKRRLSQVKTPTKPTKAELQKLMRELHLRDEQDRNHIHGPLSIPKDAIVIDNSSKGVEEIVIEMSNYIAKNTKPQKTKKKKS